MHYYAKLAKNAADHYIRSKQIPAVPRLGVGELTRQRACYVHIYERPGRRLRAMHGSPLPGYASLAEEIVAHTLLAVSRGARRAIRRPDLASLMYAVAVLEPLQRISQASQLNPTTHGLYVTSDQGKTAIVLPHRAGVETPQDQIATALREANIKPRQEAITMYTFAVSQYE